MPPRPVPARRQDRRAFASADAAAPAQRDAAATHDDELGRAGGWLY
jgi:hypothetical protein